MGFDDINDDVGDHHPGLHLGGDIDCNVLEPDNLKSVSDSYHYSMMHVNIRSLNKHHTDIISLISTSGCYFDIIGSSETWLNDNTCMELLNIEGYNLHTKNRPFRSGGGVCLYIKSTFHAKLCDFTLEDENCESLFIEIKGNKSVIIGVIYRPPDSPINAFCSNLGSLLHKINYLKKDCILLGDFNIDILYPRKMEL